MKCLSQLSSSISEHHTISGRKNNLIPHWFWTPLAGIMVTKSMAPYHIYIGLVKARYEQIAVIANRRFSPCSPRIVFIPSDFCLLQHSETWVMASAFTSLHWWPLKIRDISWHIWLQRCQLSVAITATYFSGKNSTHTLPDPSFPSAAPWSSTPSLLSSRYRIRQCLMLLCPGTIACNSKYQSRVVAFEVLG